MSNSIFLISRTDGLGDALLTLPLARAIKRQSPTSRVRFLASDAVAPFLELAVDVDEVYAKGNTAQALQGCHTVVHVFPDRQVARAAKHQGIPVRIGTRNRWWHWLTCTERVALSRKNSPLHEAELNIALAATCFGGTTPSLQSLLDVPLVVGGATPSLRRGSYVVLHPLSHGSAPRVPFAHWARVVTALIEQGMAVVVTGSAAERSSLESLSRCGALVVAGNTTPSELAGLLGSARLVVAHSTGPLHLAALMNVPVVGLYPDRRPMHAGRWGPLGGKSWVAECAVDKQYALDISAADLTELCLMALRTLSEQGRVS